MADYKSKLARGLKRIGSYYHGRDRAIARLVFSCLPNILDENEGVLATSSLNNQLGDINAALSSDTMATSLRHLVELAGQEKGVYVTTLQDAAEKVFRRQARGCELQVHGFVPSRYIKANHPDALAVKANSPIYYRGEEALASFIKRHTTHTIRKIFQVTFDPPKE